MSKKFYISDTHFGHFNIIRYDNLPFNSVEEMDETIIKNWNDRVSKEDTVYILGDFSWYKEEKTLEILKKLNGNKILIKGNHDRISTRLAQQFNAITNYIETIDNGTKVILSHYPMPFWNGQFRNSVHLYGHVHTSHQWHMFESWMKEARQLQDIPMRAYNVGYMLPYMKFGPKTLEDIICKINKLTQSKDLSNNEEDAKVINKLSEKEFYEKYCQMCGSQRCEGIGTEWFDGCAHRYKLENYTE